MLAGVAVGIFESVEDAAKQCVKAKDVTYPNLQNTEQYARLFAEYKKIHDALAPIYGER